VVVCYTSNMPTTINQIVTVGAGGVIEVRSPELHEGDQAQVTIVVVHPAVQRDAAAKGGWRQYAGAFKGTDAHAADNERIDADLAKEYGSTLDPET
jgi:hypothetical protein